MDYYPALRGDEIVAHVTTWMHLEAVMLIEIMQLQKDKNYINPLI